MYCRKCGKEISENKEYCDACETTDSGHQAVINHIDQSQVFANINNNRKICCPKCKSKNLQFVSNTEFSSKTTGGGYSAGKGCCGYMALGPLGLLCGACGSKSKTTVTSKSTNIWVCGECGNKFRSIDDIESEINSMESEKTRAKILLSIIAIIVIIVLIHFISTLGNYEISNVMPIYLLYGIPGAALATSQVLRYKNATVSIEILMSEKNDVQKNGYSE